jgi:hypothetical protein
VPCPCHGTDERAATPASVRRTRPSPQTIRAAVFDLLTSQNDRHAQNIFINGDGSMRLIDNEVRRRMGTALAHTRRPLPRSASHTRRSAAWRHSKRCKPSLSALRCRSGESRRVLPAHGPALLAQRAFFENKWLAADSILLPTTKKYNINVMENAWIHKFANWGDKVS